MSNIIPFNFNSNSVRVIEKDGEPWFVAKDVAETLGYSRARDAIKQHCKGAVKHRLPSASGFQETSLIPERDVYRLIMRSKLPEAEAFEEWVVGEVLPSIRKTGKYEVNHDINHEVPQTLSQALRFAADQAEKLEIQQKQLEHQKPAVEFVERYVEARSAKSLREVAKVLGQKERGFINWLIEEKILFRQSGNLLPFANYHHKGYFTVKTGETNGHAFQQTRFTPQGIAWISKRLGLIASVQ